MNALRTFVNESIQESFYEKKKKEKKKKVMFGNSFCFLFSKTFFGNIKKKQFSCIFEIKNILSQLKLKRQFFEKKNKKY